MQFQIKVQDQPLRHHQRASLSVIAFNQLKIGALEPILIKSNEDEYVFSAWPVNTVDSKTIIIPQSFINNFPLQNSVTIEPYLDAFLEIEKIEIEATNADSNFLLYLDQLFNQIKYFPLKDQKLSIDYLNSQIEILLKPVPSSEIVYTSSTFTKQKLLKEGKRFCIYTQNSKISLLKKKLKQSTAVNYDSIGGLKTQLKTVRDAIEVPLLQPELYLQLGIQPPKGILLYGPPGSGKTMIAKAVAQECGVHYQVINVSEIASKYYGESEKKLRNLFEEAKSNAPSLLIIDEIDSLCPKRDDSQNETEKRIVTTLLTLMDGFESTETVVVIGTTNRPNALDQALRRPGRFDKEIEIPIPDPEARFEILTKKLSAVPQSQITTENIQQIASMTHGYVGADLTALVREASLLALDRHLQSGQNQQLTYEDLLEAKLKIKPSAMREISLQIPQVRWEDIGGQDSVKQQLKQSIQWPLQHPEWFKQLDIAPPRGILLYGPPGNSKTLMAKAVATESGLNFFSIKGPEIFNKWVGESERAIQEIFKKARHARPSVIFFDEIDAIAYKRGGGDSGNSVSDRVLIQLLTEMDGVESLSQVVVMAATNRPDILDPALLRPGRLDRLIYIGLPDLETRLKILQVRTRKMPLSDQIDLQDIARQSEGMSGAEVVSLCQEAALFAMQSGQSVPEIRPEHFQSALKTVKPRTSQSALQFYQQFNNSSSSILIK